MAVSNPETLEIREYTAIERGKTVQVFGLYADQCSRGSVERHQNGEVILRFDPVGPFDFDEAKVWVQGLLELVVIGEQLKAEKRHGKRKNKRK